MGDTIVKIQKSKIQRSNNMKIFVTLGLEWFPFNRLIKIMDNFQKKNTKTHNVFIQTGRTQLNPIFCDFKDLLTPEEMKNHINQADIIVCHGGIGTVLSCFFNGKSPIIFPRLEKLGEHVDNHQVEFTNQLKKLKKTPVAIDETELTYLIENFNNLKSTFINLQNNNKQKIIDYLKKEIKKL